MIRKKIGLALSGGGARGFAHIGVLKVLAEHSITFDMIAGTSAGAIIGGALAAGLSVGDLVAMSEKIGYTNVMRPTVSLGGMFSNVPLGQFLLRHLPVSRFEDLAIPFSAVAFDLANSEKVILSGSGDLIPAIRASCAVPGIFAPVRDKRGHLLVDGGVASPMPTDVVRAMGADLVIAVDLLACGASYRSDSKTGITILIQCAMAALRCITKSEHLHADIAVQPQIAHLRPDQIGKRIEFIELGEKAARESMPEIKKLLESAASQSS